MTASGIVLLHCGLIKCFEKCFQNRTLFFLLGLLKVGASLFRGCGSAMTVLRNEDIRSLGDQQLMEKPLAFGCLCMLVLSLELGQAQRA